LPDNLSGFENRKLVCQLLEKIFYQNFEHEVHQIGPKDRKEQKKLTAARGRRIFF
jgi:hypothetical protein